MSGWTILYGIINFAILAGALYFIGRKLVAKMISGRREQIEQDLQRSEEAKVNAVGLREDLKNAPQRREAQAAELRRELDLRLEETRSEGRARDQELVDDIDSQARRGVEQIMLEARRTLTDELSAVMTETAAEKLGRELGTEEKELI